MGHRFACEALCFTYDTDRENSVISVHLFFHWDPMFWSQALPQTSVELFPFCGAHISQSTGIHNLCLKRLLESILKIKCKISKFGPIFLFLLWYVQLPWRQTRLPLAVWRSLGTSQTREKALTPMSGSSSVQCLPTVIRAHTCVWRERHSGHPKWRRRGGSWLFPESILGDGDIWFPTTRNLASTLFTNKVFFYRDHMFILYVLGLHFFL